MKIDSHTRVGAGRISFIPFEVKKRVPVKVLVELLVELLRTDCQLISFTS